MEYVAPYVKHWQSPSKKTHSTFSQRLRSLLVNPLQKKNKNKNRSNIAHPTTSPDGLCPIDSHTQRHHPRDNLNHMQRRFMPPCHAACEQRTGPSHAWQNGDDVSSPSNLCVPWGSATRFYLRHSECYSDFVCSVHLYVDCICCFIVSYMSIFSFTWFKT